MLIFIQNRFPLPRDKSSGLLPKGLDLTIAVFPLLKMN